MTVQTQTGFPLDLSDPTQLAVVRLLAERVAYQDIIGGLVHELRNPMQSMMIAAQALLDDAGKEKEHQLLDVIRRGSDQSANSIDMLGDVIGERSQPPGPVLVTDVVRWVLECHRVSKLQIEEPIDAILPPDIPAVSADSRDVATVLTLALNNAKEAIRAAHGKGGVKMSASFQDKGQGVVISVEDTGPGLPDGDTESPFLAFQTTKSREGNLGLGLAAARSLLAAYSAKIRLKNSDGGGTRCEVWIPKWERSVRQSS